MSLEVEAMGDLVTAGLVAKEVEGEAGKQGSGKHAAPCANCGTPVTANYCGSCGQKGHLHKSVLHLGEELIHGVLHFDTKGWRTLPLLVLRPGQLTRRYIDGQRTRFVSPLALFLFMMFFMFFVFSLTMGSGSDSVTTDSKDGKAKWEARMNEKIASQKEVLVEREQEVKEAEPGSRDEERAKRRLLEAQKKHEALQATLAAGNVVNSGTKLTAVDEKGDGILQQISKGMEVSVTPDSGTVGSKDAKYSDVSWVNKGIKHAVDNPELAAYKLKNAAYKYSFLLVPISMPFLWMMFFWRRGITMYDHAVFSLYSLSFMSLLFVGVATLGYLGFEGWAASLFAFVPPVHMFLHLRGTYQLSRFGAFWRTCMLLFMTLLVLTVYALVVLALSAT